MRSKRRRLPTGKVNPAAIEKRRTRLLYAIGRKEVLQLYQFPTRAVTVDEPREAIPTAPRAHVTAYFKRREIGRADLAEGDAGNPVIRFLNGLGDFPSFAPPAITHAIRVEKHVQDGVLQTRLPQIFAFCSP